MERISSSRPGGAYASLRSAASYKIAPSPPRSAVFVAGAVPPAAETAAVLAAAETAAVLANRTMTRSGHGTRSLLIIIIRLWSS